MNKLKLKALCFVLVATLLLLVVTAFTRVQAVPLLLTESECVADKINRVLNNIAWNSGDSFGFGFYSLADLAHYGYLFSKVSEQEYNNYLNLLSQNWTDILRLKRLGELDGISTTQNFDGYVIEALGNQEMLHYLPKTIEGLFYVYYRWMLECYRYAKETGITNLEEKWNLTEAYTDFLAMTNGGTTQILSCNPILNYSGGGDRYYDENAETLDMFLRFEKLGIKDAGSKADNLWRRILQTHWCGTFNFYTYERYVQLLTATAECEAGYFHTIIGEYASARNFVIQGDFSTKAIQDFQYKFLGNRWTAIKEEEIGHGLYSTLWENYTCIHAEQNHQHRLENTLASYFGMQSYVPFMDSATLNNFTEMLKGYGTFKSAWKGFLDESMLYDDVVGKFRMHSGEPFSDLASAYGSMLLLLTNIIPKTGSLACPMNDEMYQDCSSIFPATMFRFDYSERKLRIPVFSGELEFRLGTVPCSVNFLSSGVYEIVFGEGWNTIFSVKKISGLDGRFAYFKSVVIPEFPDIVIFLLSIILIMVVIIYAKKH